MNEKAEAGPIGAVFLFIVFVINWFIWLGGWLGNLGQNVIIENNHTGVEAFFYSNLNFIVMLCMILGVMGWMYFTAE